MTESGRVEPVDDEVDREFVRLTPVRAASVWGPALLVGLLVVGAAILLWWFRAPLGWHAWLLAVAVLALAVVGVEATRRAWRAHVALTPVATLGMRRFLVTGATALSALWFALGLAGGAEILIRAAFLAVAVPVIVLIRRPDGPLGAAVQHSARRLEPVLMAEAAAGLLALPIAIVVSNVVDVPDGYTYAAAAATIYALFLAISLVVVRSRRRRRRGAGSAIDA